MRAKRSKLNHRRHSGSSLVLNTGLPFRLEGIYGEGPLLALLGPVKDAGEVPPPRYPLKKGGFPGGPGGFPRAQLDYSTTSKNLISNEKCGG